MCGTVEANGCRQWRWWWVVGWMDHHCQDADRGVVDTVVLEQPELSRVFWQNSGKVEIERDDKLAK
jgi:hypothetical protein